MASQDIIRRSGTSAVTPGGKGRNCQKKVAKFCSTPLSVMYCKARQVARVLSGMIYGKKWARSKAVIKTLCRYRANVDPDGVP